VEQLARSFAVTFDYLCPFARNVFEALAAGAEAGRHWQVSYVPFSLSQAHVPEGETPAWDRPNGDRYTSGVLALQWGLAVRDRFPDRFGAFHLGAFAARHDEAKDIKEEDVLRDIAAAAGLDPDEVAAAVATGDPRETLIKEHTQAVERWHVFGVPTFIEGDQAVFVRIMERGRDDDVEQVLSLLDSTRLNEFKRTVIPR
jgi:DSBA-like thioredoxin domain-containing protein